jgi:hypothetical protein
LEPIMGISSRRTVRCTLCGGGLSIRWGPMVHPADLLCDPCLRAEWRAPATEAALEARCAQNGVIGMGHAELAAVIARKVGQLRESVPTADELEALLAARARDPFEA